MKDDQTVEGYARAIVMVAHVEGALERVEDELYIFARAVQGSGELKERLEDLRIPVGARLEILQELLGARAHPQTLAAASYVVQSGRTRQLTEIADSVAALAAKSRSQSVAEVRSAVELSADQRERLADALGRSTGGQVSVKAVVDPRVVGGLIVTMGDTVIDGSVARSLADLRSSLTGV